ncbi:MAG: hypothetical protein DWQ07_14670 [Chloroflexi bacterium]|nr:MAG: hypothetical protein DWQ07_14670 [Chloroflexota bacterium]MBL1195673.1 hypothetical protein [Chloroflexota bacterium]NOH12961.1 hypothetical protein [Chloroflexota bacterium]
METPESPSTQSGITEDTGLPMVVRLFLGGIGGFIGAVIAAGLWGLAVFYTETEFSFPAIGVGFLAGVGVLVGSFGGRGILFQAIALDFSLLGLALGHYASFYVFARDSITQNYGTGISGNVGLFSSTTLSLFIESIGELLDPFTIIWAVVAVIIAWSVPRQQSNKA